MLVALVVFTAIRLRQSPRRLDRKSRFYGSHVDQAFIVLGMIFLVIATLLLYRGAQIACRLLPLPDDGWWPFASKAISYICPDSLAFETVFIVAQIAVVMGFLSSCSTASTCTSSRRRSTPRSSASPRRSARSGRRPTSRR